MLGLIGFDATGLGTEAMCFKDSTRSCDAVISSRISLQVILTLRSEEWSGGIEWRYWSWDRLLMK